jgi:hypothetical protein
MSNVTAAELDTLVTEGDELAKAAKLRTRS